MPKPYVSLAIAALAVFFTGSLAHADTPPPGTPCGTNMVIADDHTCQAFNAHCTGYDMMVIGRVDHFGHCVIPGVNGTSW